MAEPGPAAEPVGYARRSAPAPSASVPARSSVVPQGDPAELDATAPEREESLESQAPALPAADPAFAARDAGPAVLDGGPGPTQASGAPWSYPDPDSNRAYPAGMLLTQGDWCPYLTERCVDWIAQKRDRCRRYAKPSVCHGRRISKRFCIDRYEYPNEKGVLPAVMVSWLEARDACKAEGKRLCTEDEWTFACEGPGGLPYPYGYVRNPAVCNIDRPTVIPDFKAFTEDRMVADEVFRLDQRVPSGSMARCVSPFGVHDMTGNVDEWVVNEKGEPHRSGLKGGYFGKIRARCRPMTKDHNEWFRFYQVGFRCCSAARTAVAAGVAPGVPHAARPVLP